MDETRTITDEQYIEAARHRHEIEGECEIDENAVVSVSDNGGAYVQAWVWVYDTDTLAGEEPQP